MTSKYFYPKLSKYDLGLFRIGGPGLANCMFFAAKALVMCGLAGGGYISPTWPKFSIGPYLRRERDKRAYVGLFREQGISGLRKILLLLYRKIAPAIFFTVDSLGNFFCDLQKYQLDIRNYFLSIVKPATIEQVIPNDFKDRIAIHVRLGDYVPEMRISVEWYVGIVNNILKYNPDQQFVLFSDGNDFEIADLLAISSIKKGDYGNAFADMYAISCCKLLIASDSTFSGWGAFLGNVPVLFCKRHFPPVYEENSGREWVLGESCKLPDEVVLLL